MTDVSPHIFRAYDIRGIADEELTDGAVFALGRALGTLARRRGATSFAVGRDCRLTGPRLREAMVAGLMATGLEVVDVGMVPTPLLYFAVFHLGLGGGVQITGSHNPPEYNGFKMLIGRDALYGDDIVRLRVMIAQQDFDSGLGSLRQQDVTAAYVDHVAADVKLGGRKLRVVVDAGNGAGGPVAMQLYERLGVEAVGYFIEPDGRFPNHHPDPTIVETTELMAELVAKEGADLAIGFDGDADRIGVVDERGQVQWGDRLMIVFSRALLAAEPGATIVGEVKCSQTLYDDIRARGGVGIMAKVGHSLIKATMKETGALLAGEMSGHIFFRHRYFGYDDAIYAGARLLEILSNQGRTLAELLADVPQTFATPEIRLEVPEARKFAIVGALVEELKASFEVVDIDGARVIFEGGWGLVRASNTQPVIVLRAEGQSPQRRDAIRQLLEQRVGALAG